MTVHTDPRLARVARTIERARRLDREHMRALKLHVPFWFVFAVLFALASWQILLNPFGFSDLVQRYTQDVSNLLITGPYLYPTSGRAQTSVALVDETTLHRLDMPWPWSAGAHAQMLDALLQMHPRAVVVDFLFVDPRKDDTISDLVGEIRRYQKAHVPIYFEGGVDLPYGEMPIRREIVATGAPILDPSISIYEGIVRQYPTVAQTCFGRKTADGACLSLALQVSKDLYPQAPLRRLHGQMELVWGTNTDPINAKWLRHQGQTCRDEI